MQITLDILLLDSPKITIIFIRYSNNVLYRPSFMTGVNFLHINVLLCYVVALSMPCRESTMLRVSAVKLDQRSSFAGDAAHAIFCSFVALIHSHQRNFDDALD